MAEPNDSITIVSGLPRSGTSLMMQMLSAGGMSALTDEKRTLMKAIRAVTLNLSR